MVEWSLTATSVSCALFVSLFFFSSCDQLVVQSADDREPSLADSSSAEKEREKKILRSYPATIIYAALLGAHCMMWFVNSATKKKSGLTENNLMLKVNMTELCGGEKII